MNMMIKPCNCYRLPRKSEDPSDLECLKELVFTGKPLLDAVHVSASAVCANTGIVWNISGYKDRQFFSWDYHLAPESLERVVQLAREKIIEASDKYLADQAVMLKRNILAEQLLRNCLVHAASLNDAITAVWSLNRLLKEKEHWQEIISISEINGRVVDVLNWSIAKLHMKQYEGVADIIIRDAIDSEAWKYINEAGSWLASGEPGLALLLPVVFFYNGELEKGCTVLEEITFQLPLSFRFPLARAICLSLGGTDISQAVEIMKQRSELFTELKSADWHTPREDRLYNHIIQDILRHEFLSFSGRDVWIATGKVISRVTGYKEYRCLYDMFISAGKGSGMKEFHIFFNDSVESG